MTIKAYCRCNSGHYFVGECCPFDGWSSPASRELLRAVDRLEHEHKGLSIAALKDLGVSKATLARTIVIEFGSGAVFDALAADYLVVEGEPRRVQELDRSFK